MDFNLWEITGLVILAIIVFGPEKLPELARKAARVLNYLRRIGNDARGQLRKELGPEFDDLSLADLNPRAFVAKHLLSGEEVEDLRQIRDEAIASGSLVKDTLADARAATEATPVEAAGGTAAPEASDPPSSATDAVPPTASEALVDVRTSVPFDPEAT